MNILLARIDDRFIHGQVTVGWSQSLRPERIILVNDEIAADSWQCRVYASSVPPQIAVSIWDLETALAKLTAPGERMGSGERVILLTGGPADMYRLFSGGLPLASVNLGGMHYARGRQEMLSCVWVDENDLELLRNFLDGGVRLAALLVPGGVETAIDRNLLAEMEGRF